MDVLKFLEEGNVRPNPEYNPKTKEGKYKAPTLVDYNAGTSVNDIGTKSISSIAAKNLYSLNSEDVDKYAKYKTYLNPVDDKETLDRERANNQSVLEQASRSLGQAVVNEVIIGSFLGLSNLFDAGINGIRYLQSEMTGEDYTNDYTNIVSKRLEEIQDNVRNELEIYRKDPNASWAVTDFGWWADNMVSVASTASMLLPTMLITKGLSAIGRGIRTAAAADDAGRLVKGLNKAGDFFSADAMAIKLTSKFGKKYEFMSDAGKLRDQLRSGREIVQNAFMSRTMEGYLEAREVYKQVNEDAINRFKNFTDEQRDTFFKNNPELVGKSDEEIADKIASDSANKTFLNDYTMLLMDAVQFKALGELYTSGRKASKATLALKQKKAKDAVLGITNPNKRPILDSDFMWKVKYNLAHPTEGLFAVEWSEGIEEGFQGIQTEKGKEVMEKYFNPAFTPREISDYLKDPEIWEQVFWGVIGAVGFAGAAKGIDYLSKKANKALDKYLVDEKEIEIRKLAEEIARGKDIDGYADRVNNFIQGVNNIKEGKNPYRNVITADGKIEMETIEDQDKIDQILDHYINDFVTEMGINASDRGNFDILYSFLTDPDISKHIAEQTKSTDDVQAYTDMLSKKLKAVSDNYTRELYNIRTTIKVDNPFVAQAMARDITRTRLNLENVDKMIKENNDLIADLNINNIDYNAWYERTIANDFYNAKLNQFDAKEKSFLNDYNNGKISRQAYDEYVNDLNKQRAALTKFVLDNTSAGAVENLTKLFSAVESSLSSEVDTSSLSHLTQELNQFTSQFQLSTLNIPTVNIQKLMLKKIGLTYAVEEINAQLPKTQEDFQREYDAKSQFVDKLVNERVKQSATDIIDWIEKQDNLDEAKSKLYKDEVPELKEQLNVIKIGHENTREFWANINTALNAEKRKREKHEQDKQTITVDGQQLSQEEAAAVREEATNETPITLTSTDSTVAPEQAPTNPPVKKRYNVGDIVTYANYDENGNETARYNATISEIFDNGSVKFEDGVSRSADTFNIFFGDKEAKYRGAHTKILNIKTTDGQILSPIPFTGAPKQAETSATVYDGQPIQQPAVAQPVQPLTPAELALAKDEWSAAEPTPAESAAVEHEAKIYSSDEMFQNQQKTGAIVKDIYKINHDRFLSLTAKDINTPAFTDLLNEITERVIIDIGVDKNTARVLANMALKTQFQMIAKNSKYSHITMLVEAMANKVRYSSIGEIETINTIEQEIEAVNNITTAYINEVGVNKFKGETKIINLYDLYNHVVNNPDIDTYSAIAFFRNMQSIIKDKSKRAKLPYHFLNIRQFNKIVNNPILLKTTLNNIRESTEFEEKYEHAVISNDPKAREIIDTIPFQAELDVVNHPNFNSLSIRYKGEEIGYLAKVSKSKDNNTFSRRAYDNFSYSVTKVIDDDGNVIYKVQDTLDDFIRILLTEPETNDEYSKIRELLVSPSLSKNDDNFILNSSIFKQLVKEDILQFKKETTNSEKARIFIRALNNIIFYNNRAATDIVRYASWTVFKQKLFNNFQFTHNLSNSVNTKIRWVNKWDGGVNYYEDGTELDCGDASLGLTAENNPLAIVNNENESIINTDGYSETSINAAGFPRGTMGFTLRYSKNGSALALVTGQNPVTHNAKFTKRLTDELTSIFTNYFNSNTEFNDLINALHNLFSGPAKDNNVKSLFRGLSVIRDEAGTFVSLGFTENKERRFLIKINKNNKNTGEVQHHIVFSPDGTNKNAIVIREDGANLQKAIEVIVNKVTFNTSFFTILNKNKANTSNSKHFRINDAGKMVVELGGKTEIYDSFTDFAIKENVFRTNAYKENGSFFNYEGASGSIYLDVEGRATPDPVPNNKTPTIDDILESKTPVKTNTILEALNVSNNIIDFLTGNNVYNIKLIPDSVRLFNGNKKINAKYTKTGISLNRKISNRKSSNIVRVLIHEELHKKFATLSDTQRRRILNDLTHTYNAFIESLNIDTSNLSENERKIIEKLKEFSKQLAINNGAKDSENIKDAVEKLTDKQREVLMEEWLVESISQNDLRKYLNNTYYGETTVGEPQTILQKIIKLLLELFGISSKNINNNTILAKQFEILGEQTESIDDTTVEDNNTSNDTTAEANTVTDETAPVTPPVEGQESNQTPIEEDTTTESAVETDNTLSDEDRLLQDALNVTEDEFSDDDSGVIFDEDYDTLYSSIDEIIPTDGLNSLDEAIANLVNNENINPKGIISIENMNEFLSKFDANLRPDIIKGMEDGTINYICI